MNQTSAAGVIVCPGCEHANDSSRRFCGNCGSSLWAACPTCQEDCPVVESFCGKCGANLRALQQQRVDELDDRIKTVDQLQAEHRYDEALQQLRVLTSLEDKRFESYKQVAAKRVEQLKASRDRLMAAAQTAYKAASKYLDKQNYEKAVALLELTPEPLRDEDFQRLYQECDSRRKEVLTLGGEIRDGLLSKQLGDLGAKIDQLLALKSNHTHALEIAGKLRERFYNTALKRISEEKYGEALQWLDRIPQVERDDAVDKLTSQATELHWLKTDIRSAATANHTLLAVAERLLKAVKSSEDVQNRRQKIKQRISEGPDDARLVAADWFVPRRTPFGCPIDSLAGFYTLACADKKPLKEHPSRFFTAIGLALQGVDRAPTKVNLIPKKTGLLSKLPFKSRQPKPTTVAWGIDIGTTALKAVKISVDENDADAKPRIECVECMPHQRPLNHPDVSSRRNELIEEILTRFAEKHDTQGAKICVSIAHKLLLCRFIDMPPVSEKQVDELIPIEVQHQIPFPLDEIAWDHQVLHRREVEEDDELESLRVIIVAAKKDVIEQHLSCFEAAQIKVDVVQSDCLALHSFAACEFLSKKSDNDQCVMLLDIGTDSSNIVISSPDSAWFRSISIGGDQITKALVREFKLTNQQAEQLKAEPWKARRLSKLYEVIDPVIEKLVGEVERNLSLFHKDSPNASLTQIHGIGGGFQMYGLLRRLRIGRNHLDTT